MSFDLLLLAVPLSIAFWSAYRYPRVVRRSEVGRASRDESRGKVNPRAGLPVPHEIRTGHPENYYRPRPPTIYDRRYPW